MGLFVDDKKLRIASGGIYFLLCVTVFWGLIGFLRSDHAAPVFTFLLSFYSSAQTEKPESVVGKRQKTDGIEITGNANMFVPSDMGNPSDTKYKTPTDVFDMETEYLAAFAQSDTDGRVLSDDFSQAGITDQVGHAMIRNATAEQNPDFEELLSMGAALQIPETQNPLVLIYHTHTTESYLLADNGVFWSAYDTHTDASDRNMIRVGTVLKNVLEEAGIGVIHDTTVYDVGYDGAYARSRQGIEAILAENPSIQIVLDVHRDAFYYSDSSRGKPVAEIDGKKAAQIMIISGAEEGQITDFPDWEYNLRFALELQNTASTMFEGLMRPLYFCQRKYNMDVTRNALLLEIGSDANTLDEALYAAHLCGLALLQVIENHK